MIRRLRRVRGAGTRLIDRGGTGTVDRRSTSSCVACCSRRWCTCVQTPIRCPYSVTQLTRWPFGPLHYRLPAHPAARSTSDNTCLPTYAPYAPASLRGGAGSNRWRSIQTVNSMVTSIDRRAIVARVIGVMIGPHRVVGRLGDGGIAPSIRRSMRSSVTASRSISCSRTCQWTDNLSVPESEPAPASTSRSPLLLGAAHGALVVPPGARDCGTRDQVYPTS